MDDDTDFTFCQVHSSVDSNGYEEQKSLPDISVITIKEEMPNGSGSVLLWNDKLPNNVNTKKPEAVGSLSFNVIGTLPSNQLSHSPKQPPSEAATSSAKISQKTRVAMRKPAPRAKVPFEKGYSQMDWLKLTQTHPDLAGLKGQSNRRRISMNEVKQHQTEGTMWTVLKGRVYNLSPYMKFHPGGFDKLMEAVGKDCTSLFNKYHAWVNADFLLEKCLVGVLDDGHH